MSWVLASTEPNGGLESKVATLITPAFLISASWSAWAAKAATLLKTSRASAESEDKGRALRAMCFPYQGLPKRQKRVFRKLHACGRFYLVKQRITQATQRHYEQKLISIAVKNIR